MSNGKTWSTYIIGTADVTNKDSLKVWIDSMDRTIRYCQATDVLTIELVGTLASGPLARVIATYIDTQNGLFPP